MNAGLVPEVRKFYKYIGKGSEHMKYLKWLITLVLAGLLGGLLVGSPPANELISFCHLCGVLFIIDRFGGWVSRKITPDRLDFIFGYVCCWTSFYD